ncbi:MAG: VIT1/CCC1 transporter family protein [bacterium]|nr:VIT1/CCC1 transporter family protein [bacterium]
MTRITELLVRNIIFGVEDSLVSTMGLLAGVAVSGVSRSTIIVTGAILIFVEGFSMGAGSLLTEHSVAEFQGKEARVTKRDVLGGAIMLASYFFAGFIPLLPYVFLSVQAAFWVSIACSLLALFLLGIGGALVFRTRAIGHGLEMLLVGGGALAIGVAVGRVVHGFV